jgi:hypothetical protein
MSTRITIHHDRHDDLPLLGAVEDALLRDFPGEITVAFQSHALLASWRVEVPEDHDVLDNEGDEYTVYALWASLCGTIESACFDAGASNPL